MSASQAVTLGQVDDFEDGTVQGWHVGSSSHPFPPTNIATGGPGGVDDNWLRLTAIGGSGAGSRLTVMNASQWTGDYVAAGVTSISMHLINLGSTDLHLRLQFENWDGFSPVDVAMSSSAVVVPAGSGWVSVVFPIAPSDLTLQFGNLTQAVTSTDFVRFFHSTSATFPGSPITAQLGVDNIRAVPEPGTLAACALGIGWLSRRRRSRPNSRP